MNRLQIATIAVAVAVLGWAFALAATAADHCGADCQQCQCGPIMTVHAEQLPAGAPCTNYLLVGRLYAVSLDPETRLATWCAYRVTSTSGDTRNAIERRWINLLPDVTLKASDYSGPLYDLGHLAPLAALKNSPHAFELNAMVNVAPQTPDLNRGPWVKIETLARELADAHETADVVVGPLYERPMPPLPAAPAERSHRVPSAYWAVIFPEGAEARAFIVDQACGRADPLSKFAVSVAAVSKRSGLTFARQR